MATTSSSGEANELIGEVAKSEVDEMDGAVAATSGGGEASELSGEASGQQKKKKKKSKWDSKKTSHDRREAEARRERRG